MNKFTLILFSSCLFFNQIKTLWSKKDKPDSTCRFQGTAGTYPDELCSRNMKFIIRLKLFRAQEKIFNLQKNLEYIKKNPRILNDPYDMEAAEQELTDNIKIAQNKLAILKTKYSKFFNDDTGELGEESNQTTLLYGPMGTGKTTIAKKMAEASKSKFIYLSGGSIITTYQNEGTHKIKDLFNAAEEMILNGEAKSVTIYIDELDKFASVENCNNKKEYDAAIAELWQGLDKIQNNPKIRLIATTNKYHTLDKFLLDRFDDEGRIFIENPDSNMRRELFKFFFEKANTSKLNSIKDIRGYFSPKNKSNEDLVLDYLVSQTEGKSARFIKQYVSNAASYAFDHNNKVLTFEILKKCFNRIKEKEEMEKKEKQKLDSQQQANYNNRNVKSFAYDVGTMITRDMIMLLIKSCIRVMSSAGTESEESEIREGKKC